MENTKFIEATKRLIQDRRFGSIETMNEEQMAELAKEISEEEESGLLYNKMFLRIQAIGEQRKKGTDKKLIDSLSNKYNDYDFNKLDNLDKNDLKMLLRELKIDQNNISMKDVIKCLTLEELEQLNAVKKIMK